MAGNYGRDVATYRPGKQTENWQKVQVPGTVPAQHFQACVASSETHFASIEPDTAPEASAGHSMLL
jgi:hypothetical protein